MLNINVLSRSPITRWLGGENVWVGTGKVGDHALRTRLDTGKHTHTLTHTNDRF